MLDVINIKKKFIKQITPTNKVQFFAVDNISFNVDEGKIFGILGPNGAGKTTLLRIIAGIMEPTSGEVIVNDMRYNKNPVEIKEKIAFLSGNTKLYKDISPYELLVMFSEYYDIPKDIMKNRIKKISNRLDMNSFLYQKIENLSTGQNQRVSIARCLVHNPQYYILDEATSGLDAISSKTILDFIKEEKDNGKTILYSTHYMEEAENICDEVILIYKGKIMAQGSPKIIKNETKTTNLREAFLALVKGVSNE